MSTLDSCATPAGSRLLRQWLCQPLRDRAIAAARHAAIAELRTPACPHRALAALLKTASDVERIAARIALRSARPRELAGLRDTLAVLPTLASRLDGCASTLLQGLRGDLAMDARWPALLKVAIAPEPAAQLRDGGVIASGHDAELDELRAIDAHCGEFLLDLEKRERERTAIPSLKGRVQPRARLLHRGDPRARGQGAGRLPAPADAQERGALHHAGAQSLRGQGAVGAGTCARARARALRCGA
jgi:DNA mismatch repair protein MutS